MNKIEIRKCNALDIWSQLNRVLPKYVGRNWNYIKEHETEIEATNIINEYHSLDYCYSIASDN